MTRQEGTNRMNMATVGINSVVSVSAGVKELGGEKLNVYQTIPLVQAGPDGITSRIERYSIIGMEHGDNAIFLGQIDPNTKYFNHLTGVTNENLAFVNRAPNGVVNGLSIRLETLPKILTFDEFRDGIGQSIDLGAVQYPDSYTGGIL